MNKEPLNSVFSRVIAWVLLIQIINLSIDPIDAVHDKFGNFNTSEDLSVNEIESIYELIAENVLGLDIPENDEDDGNGVLKMLTFYFVQPYFPVDTPHLSPFTFFPIEEHLTSIILDHTSPPPRVG